MMVRRTGFIILAFAGLAACGPDLPESGPGYNSYDPYRAPGTSAVIPAAPVISSEVLDLSGSQPRVTSVAPTPAPVPTTSFDAASVETRSVVGSPRNVLDLRDQANEAINTANLAGRNSGAVPVQASPSNPAPAITVTPGANPQLSDENDFKAVSSERTIQDDKALLERNRSLYTVVQPGELPPRPDGSPNIVGYALKTNNPVGRPMYKRSTFRAEVKYARACGSYASPDLAQAAFLASGGPMKDKLGVDPDGDGFACTWDPTPFRRAVQN